MTEKIKVLVVDDSAFMRKVITDLIVEDPKLSVVATARNGQDALAKIGQYRPDVVTLDVEMPILDGLETLKKIMAECPLPVVMVSSTTKAGADNTLLAIEFGAVDFIAKPSGPISLDLPKIKHELCRKVLSAASVQVKTLLLPKKAVSEFSAGVTTEQRLMKYDKKIIAIGTSTGGPKALQHVLTQIPKDINAPIVIVQHMPPGFTASLASRLNTLSHIHVKEASNGEVLENGVAYIAPGGFHLKVKKMGTSFIIQTEASELRKGHRPSVDVMYESLALIKQCQIIAVIMTGMGSDGTEGLIALKKSNSSCYAIAESEETSIVFGMPKAAIKTNFVDEVAGLNHIAASILRQC